MPNMRGKLQWIEKEVPILGASPRAVVADLVGLTQDIEGHYLEVLIHPEIQTHTDAEMGWRVLEYNAGLLLQQRNPNARVLTFVYYHCRGGGPVQHQRHVLGFHGYSVHEVGYSNVGVGDLHAEEYAESENPFAWALAAWMSQRPAGRVQLRLRLLHRILGLVRDEGYRHLLLDAVRSYFKLSRTEQAEERRLLQSGEFGEVGEMLQTELGKLEERARREGQREGQREAL
jgi:hypothetical protein